jgi:hypothetical protein
MVPADMHGLPSSSSLDLTHLLPAAGEIIFVVVGVMLQGASIVFESVRLTLVQILLQKRGIKLNPISSLYHIAPCCFVFLFLPFTYIELPKMVKDPNLHINVPLLLASAGSAFGESPAWYLHTVVLLVEMMLGRCIMPCFYVC